MSIIYFIDSARMRTLTMSVGRLRLVIAGVVCLCLWSLGSVFLTVHLVSSEAQLEGRLKLALNSIFEYEIRDEHVFDLLRISNVDRAMSKDIFLVDICSHGQKLSYHSLTAIESSHIEGSVALITSLVDIGPVG